MMEYEFPDEFRWTKCHPIALFTAPLIHRITSVRSDILFKDASKIAKNLTDEVRRSDMLMIWTDCDREGENIGYEIAQHCMKVKNILVKRAKFSAVIAE